jgi:peptidoglycan/LPS O-acetylase OafA/YrhL
LPAASPANPSAASKKAVILGTGPSLFLDAVRLLAALAVAIGHESQAQFSSGWRDLTSYAVNAVTAFFLLSGVVIRYVTLRRRETLSSYLAERASRIYSVTLPAIAVACIVEIILSRTSPGTISGGGNLHRLPLLIFANLTFISSFWHHGLNFAADGAMWSLSFECAYYVLYGLAFYLAGWKRSVFLFVTVVAVGPEIMVLLPIWLGGCLLFECFERSRGSRLILPALCLLVAGGILAGISTWRNGSLATPHLRSLFHTLEHRAITTGRFSFLVPHIGPGYGISLDAYLWGAIFFISMLAGLLFVDRFSINGQERWARILRVLAEATFPLYLFHLPLYFLVVAAVGHSLGSEVAKVAMLAGVFAISVLLGEVCNKFKLILRGWLKPRSLSQPSR